MYGQATGCSEMARAPDHATTTPRHLGYMVLLACTEDKVNSQVTAKRIDTGYQSTGTVTTCSEVELSTAGYTTGPISFSSLHESNHFESTWESPLDHNYGRPPFGPHDYGRPPIVPHEYGRRPTGPHDSGCIATSPQQDGEGNPEPECYDHLYSQYDEVLPAVIKVFTADAPDYCVY